MMDFVVVSISFLLKICPMLGSVYENRNKIKKMTEIFLKHGNPTENRKVKI